MFHMQCIVLGKSAGLMRPWRFSLSKKAAFGRPFLIRS
jgi:hypothetical protein